MLLRMQGSKQFRRQQAGPTLRLASTIGASAGSGLALRLASNL